MSFLRRNGPEATEAPALQRELHPVAQEAAVIYSNALQEMERLRAQVSALSEALRVEERCHAITKMELARQTGMREYYERYCHEMHAGMETAEAALRAVRVKAVRFAKEGQNNVQGETRISSQSLGSWAGDQRNLRASRADGEGPSGNNQISEERGRSESGPENRAEAYTDSDPRQRPQTEGQ